RPSGHVIVGGPQHINGGGRSGGPVPRGDGGGCAVLRGLHGGSLRRCGSRLADFVSTLPADKFGWRMTRPRNGIVVVTPSMIKESSAWRMRASASVRVLPCTMTLASSES